VAMRSIGTFVFALCLVSPAWAQDDAGWTFNARFHGTKNLNIPFDQLKTRMTGDDAMSLGQAIKELRPEMDDNAAKNEAKKAEKQAKETEKNAKTTR